MKKPNFIFNFFGNAIKIRFFIRCEEINNGLASIEVSVRHIMVDDETTVWFETPMGNLLLKNGKLLNNYKPILFDGNSNTYLHTLMVEDDDIYLFSPEFMTIVTLARAKGWFDLVNKNIISLTQQKEYLKELDLENCNALWDGDEKYSSERLSFN